MTTAGDEVETSNTSALLEVLEIHRPPASWLRVVEIGMGDEPASVPYLRAGARVVGIDASAANLSRIAQRYPEFHALVGHDLRRGIPADVRLGDADLVIVGLPLGRLGPLEQALGVLARLLAPGGMVALRYVPRAPRQSATGMRCDTPETIARALESIGWTSVVHDRYDDATTTYGRVVARDRRPAELLPAALQTIDRTACIDRDRVLAAFRRTPWRPSERPHGEARELLLAARAGIDAGTLELRGMPWPTPPAAVTVPEPSRCDLLAIMPHPDDESVYGGGTIAALVAAGRSVHLAVATDGGGGRGGSDLRRRRARELLAAAAVLGIRAVESFGWADFGKYHDAARTRPFTQIDALRIWGFEPCLLRVVRCIRKHRPRVVLSLDPEVDPNYSLHGQHLALGFLVALGFRLAADGAYAPGAGPPWSAFEHRVMSPRAEAAFGTVVEIDRVRKRAALEAHESQRYSTDALRRSLADPHQPALEVIRLVQAVESVPLWAVRARGESLDDAIDWHATTRRRMPPRARAELVDLLRTQARSRPPDPSVDAALERLADPRSVAVVTGQQVGLLGGPALTLHKALAAVALARRLEKRGVVAIAVFWMATHDHDIDEVRAVPRLEGSPVRLAIQSDGAPVGDLELGLGVRALLEEWSLAIGPSAELRALLEGCFRPEATFASAFADFLGAITRGMGLVIFDPADPRACALARPVLERELLGPERMDQPLADARARLRAQGREETISTTRDVLQLFITTEDGRRHRLRRTHEGVAWPGGELTVGAARALLKNAPERFTPSALLRPLVQDAILPTIAYVAGPTEARYLEQLREAYAWAEIPMPKIVRRPSIRVLSHRDVATLAEVGTLERLAASHEPEAVIGRAGLPEATGAWLRSLEPLLERAAVARRAVREGAAVDWVELRRAWQVLDARAGLALSDVQRVAPTWAFAVETAMKAIDACTTGEPRVRPLTRALRGLVRVRRSLLREGRRRRAAATLAWRRAAPVPHAPERRASVAELLARFGPDLPHALLRALERNFVPELVVQGEGIA